METQNNSSDSATPKKEVSPEARHKKNTALAALILFVPFCVVMYLILDGSSQEAPPGASPIQDIPEAPTEKLDGNKLGADKRQAHTEFQAQRVKSLAEESPFLLKDTTPRSNSPDRLAWTGSRATRQPSDAIGQSQQTYQEVSRQVASFYRPSAQADPEVARLREQVADLTRQLQQKSGGQNDPTALLEQSYRLAAKYLHPAPAGDTAPPVAALADPPAVGAARVPDRTVSSLQPPLPDSVLIKQLSQPRNYGFLTAVGDTWAEGGHNSIRVCINDDQSVTPAATVRLRLLEPMQVGRITIPTGTVIYGTTRIEGVRLGIVVQSIEYHGSILPVNLVAHDMDGLPGLNVPNSTEREALKNAAASIGSGFGTSVSFARSAGQQVAMDVVRGVLSGASQYVASKIREVKVTLKSDYQLLLISNE